MIETYVLLNPTSKLVKIGRTSNFEKRKLDLERACGTRLILLLRIARDIEHVLHQRYAEHRKVGEWFELVGVESAQVDFRAWLALQVYRDDQIGDLARDHCDQDCEDLVVCGCCGEMKCRLQLHGRPSDIYSEGGFRKHVRACTEARAAMQRACQEWAQVTQQGSKRRRQPVT